MLTSQGQFHCHCPDSHMVVGIFGSACRLNIIVQAVFYIRGSVHRESNLITVQQDATYSVHYISVGSSTCFGC